MGRLFWVGSWEQSHDSNTAAEERQLLIWHLLQTKRIGESFLELVVVEMNLQEKKRKVKQSKLKQKEMRDFMSLETQGGSARKKEKALYKNQFVK